MADSTKQSELAKKIKMVLIIAAIISIVYAGARADKIAALISGWGQ